MIDYISIIYMGSDIKFVDLIKYITCNIFGRKRNDTMPFLAFVIASLTCLRKFNSLARKKPKCL